MHIFTISHSMQVCSIFFCCNTRFIYLPTSDLSSSIWKQDRLSSRRARGRRNCFVKFIFSFVFRTIHLVEELLKIICHRIINLNEWMGYHLLSKYRICLKLSKDGFKLIQLKLKQVELKLKLLLGLELCLFAPETTLNRREWLLNTLTAKANFLEEWGQKCQWNRTRRKAVVDFKRTNNTSLSN